MESTATCPICGGQSWHIMINRVCCDNCEYEYYPEDEKVTAYIMFNILDECEKKRKEKLAGIGGMNEV